jgi:ribulose-bisphosphate carboxylase large chain
MNRSPSRFDIVYQIVASTENEARDKAEKASVEQSVEMPLHAVPEQAKTSVPKLTSLKAIANNLWQATVSFPYLLIGDDIIQFLNILYGNISLYSDIKVTDVSNEILDALFSGPAFGVDGIRKLTGVISRPLSCTALKPIGLTPKELAERAELFANGGIDIIKDDHGLTNQPSAIFEARTKACTEAVRRAVDKTGKQTLYFPNVTTHAGTALERVEMALENGAHGILICPQLTGLSVISEIRTRFGCPIMAHPSFSGSLVTHKTSGISMSLYYGKIWRSLGADAVIFPNPGGRFPFSRNECVELHNTLTDKTFPFQPAFPVPAGGIQLSSVEDFKHLYGNETIFLIGGSLYEHPDGIETATRIFQETLI